MVDLFVQFLTRIQYVKLLIDNNYIKQAMNLHFNTSLQGGKYKITSILGQGGFGITYLGLKTGLNLKVAIKEFFMKEYCTANTDTSH